MIFQTETLNPRPPNAGVRSAPPPGVSPPPQSPPPYTQYSQQPPPGYPPQYPPQQPYYAPPAPPPKKSNLALIIVLVVVIVVVVLAVLAWYVVTVIMAPIQSTTAITVSGASFSLDYPGTNSWFGSGPITACSNCPIKVSLVQQFSYTLTLTNSDTVSHNVTAVTLAGSSFQIVTISPATPSASSPVVWAAGQTKSLVLTIQPSTFGGTYTLTGTVTTD